MRQLQTGIDVLVARREAGLTQRELSEITGIHKTALCRIEWSRRRLTPERAQQIQRAIESVGTPADPGSKVA